MGGRLVDKFFGSNVTPKRLHQSCIKIWEANVAQILGRLLLDQFRLWYSLKACWILNTAETLHVININVTFLQGKKSRLTPLLYDYNIDRASHSPSSRFH